jgi:hypothetical protein
VHKTQLTYDGDVVIQHWIRVLATDLNSAEKGVVHSTSPVRYIPSHVARSIMGFSRINKEIKNQSRKTFGEMHMLTMHSYHLIYRHYD